MRTPGWSWRERPRAAAKPNQTQPPDKPRVRASLQLGAGVYIHFGHAAIFSLRPFRKLYFSSVPHTCTIFMAHVSTVPLFSNMKYIGMYNYTYGYFPLLFPFACLSLKFFPVYLPPFSTPPPVLLQLLSIQQGGGAGEGVWCFLHVSTPVILLTHEK